MRPLYQMHRDNSNEPNMTVNITCITSQYILYYILSQLSEGIDGWGGWKGTDAYLHLVILQKLLSKATYNWGTHIAR